MASNHWEDVEEPEAEDHIRVVLRCSPRNIMQPNTVAGSTIVHMTDLKQILLQSLHNWRTGPEVYTFDEVFAPAATQLEVYNEVVCPLVEDVVGGLNCTIIAYGAMGTGKTFTMVGQTNLGAGFTWNQASPAGIFPRAIYQIFEGLSAEISVRVSLHEMTAEKRVDLLQNHVSPHGRLVRPLEERLVTTAPEAWDIVRTGLSRRRRAHTPINAHSTRSHVVFTIMVRIRNGNGGYTTGTLHLVDLASSENAQHYQVPDERAQEGGAIHRSLLALGRVIAALAAERRRNIPYRESKLTRFLRESLGGATKTTIIATVPQACTDLGETRVTMENASKARRIVNKAQAQASS